jgi:hypothetical protein
VSLANIDVAAYLLSKAPLTTLSILITVPKLYVDSYISSRIRASMESPTSVCAIVLSGRRVRAGLGRHRISCICISLSTRAQLLRKRFFVLLEGGAITDDFI